MSELVPTAQSIKERLENFSRARNLERGAPQAVLLLDASGSMAGEGLAQAVRGAKSYTRDAHARGHRVSLLTFASDAEVLTRDLPPGRDPAPHLRRMRAEGSTNLTAGLSLAGRLLRGSGGRTVCVVTDGYPDSAQAALAAAQRLKAQGVHIACIGTSDADQAFLARLASRAGLARKVRLKELERAITDAARMLPKA